MTTKQRFCSFEIDETRFDVLAGERYETGFTLACPNELREGEDALCSECRKKVEEE